MNEIIIVALFLIWYIGSLIVSEIVSKDSKIGTEWIFFISMIFSPIIGLIVYVFAKQK
ncbi:MAG: hypothetical protein GY834_03825 [Bacteroidetes bacterium]|nr:hypothetical protein [Bacteroidota bacterium]